MTCAQLVRRWRVEQIPAQLLAHGPLGLLCLLLLYAVVHLYKKQREMEEKYRADLNALVDRYVAKAETWVEKGTELASNLNKVLESITRAPRA